MLMKRVPADPYRSHKRSLLCLHDLGVPEPPLLCISTCPTPTPATPTLLSQAGPAKPAPWHVTVHFHQEALPDPADIEERLALGMQAAMPGEVMSAGSGGKRVLSSTSPGVDVIQGQSCECSDVCLSFTSTCVDMA